MILKNEKKKKIYQFLVRKLMLALRLKGARITIEQGSYYD